MDTRQLIAMLPAMARVPLLELLQRLEVLDARITALEQRTPPERPPHDDDAPSRP
jgi:hypothetical protein